MRDIYCHPRDDKGQLEVDHGPQVDAKTWFYKRWRANGLETHQIDQKWAETMAEQKKMAGR